MQLAYTATDAVLGAGDAPLKLGEGVKLGGRVWHPVKAHHMARNVY
jgi:hypothetical protein